MRAVDTNVLLRLIVRDDTRQVALAQNFIAKGAWVSVLALAETVWVLSTVYHLDSPELIKVIGMLLSHRELTLQEPEVVRSALDLFRARPTLGFSDCLMLRLAQKAGHLPLGTFDKSLAKLEGTQRL